MLGWLSPGALRGPMRRPRHGLGELRRLRELLFSVVERVPDDLSGRSVRQRVSVCLDELLGDLRRCVDGHSQLRRMRGCVPAWRNLPIRILHRLRQWAQLLSGFVLGANLRWVHQPSDRLAQLRRVRKHVFGQHGLSERRLHVSNGGILLSRALLRGVRRHSFG